MGAGGELQDVDTTVGRCCRVDRLVRYKASIRGNHYQVELRFRVGSRSGAPAKVYQLIFGVEIDVTGGGLGLDDGGFTGRLSKSRWSEQHVDRNAMRQWRVGESFIFN